MNFVLVRLVVDVQSTYRPWCSWRRSDLDVGNFLWTHHAIANALDREAPYMKFSKDATAVS